MKVFLHAFPPSRSRFARAAALALVLLVFGGAAHAQLYWDNNGSTTGFGTATGTWAAPTTNDATQGWSSSSTGATLPTGTTTTTTSDALNFGTSTNQIGTGTITVSGNVSANTITLVGSSSHITLSGGNITLGGTSPGITVTNSANTNAITDTISSNITLGANQTWTVNNGGSTGTANLTVSGIISGSNLGITKAGNGTLTLSGANTYSGGTTVNSGSLILTGGTGRIVGALTVNGSGVAQYSVNANNYFGSLSSLTISNGGTFIDGAIGAAVQTTPSVTFNNGGTLTSAAGANGLGGFGNFLFTGGITVSGTGLATINATGVSFHWNQTVTVADTVSGSGVDLEISSAIGSERSLSTLTKEGAGTLLLTGNNTSFANWTISNGTLEIGASGRLMAGNYNGTISNNGSFIYSGTNAQTLSGNITGTGSLTKNNTSTLTLSGVANTYNGSTTINGGTLLVTGNISSSAITLNSGATIAAGTAATVSKVNAAALTVAGNTGYIFTIGNISGGTVGTAGTDYDQIATSGAITFNNTVNNPFTIYINGTPTNWSSSGSYTWNILSGASISGFSAANFVADTASFGGSLASGASWTFGTSGGNLTLTYGTSGTPTWAGGTGVWSGNFTPSLSNNLDMFFTGAGGVATNDIASGTLSSVGSITFNSTAGSYTLAANSGSAGNGSALTLAGSMINNSASAQTINTALSIGATRTINTASGNITIGGAISGAGGLTKTGNSTLTLSGANTYTGVTTVNAGTLALGANQTLGAIAGAGNLSLSNYYLTTNSSSSTTYSGVISGTGGLTKNGTGTLTLSGTNTYTGGTTINTGTIILSGANAMQTSTIVNSGATLQSNRDDAIQDATAITLNGGTLAMQTYNDYIGNLTLSNNAAVTGTGTGTQSLINNGVANSLISTNGTGNAGTISSRISLTSQWGGATGARTQEIRVGDNSTLTISGVIQNSAPNSAAYAGSILTSGNGTLVLTGNNTYTGGTTINAGTLEIGSSGRLGAGTYAGAITNNGTLIYSGTNAQTLSGVISGTGALTKNNSSSTLTLSGTNTYTGATIVNAGTLQLTGAGKVGTGVLTVASGATLALNSNQTVAGLSGAGNITWNGGASTVSDGSALISSAKNYTQLLDFGNGGGATVNGVAFNSVTTSGTGWALTGAGTAYNTDSGTGYNQLMSDFYYGGNPGALSFTGLTTGAYYEAVIYTRIGDWPNRAQNATFTNNGTTQYTLSSIDPGTFGAVVYRFQAQGTNASISMAPLNGANSLHWFGASLELVGNSIMTVGDSGNYDFSGAISGLIAITKVGTGTQTLSGNNTYTGATTINTGTLLISSTGLLGGGNYSGNIANSGSFVFASNSNQTLSGNISGTGSLTKNGSGVLTLTGTSSFNGATTISAGTLVVNGSAANSAVTIGNGGILGGNGTVGALTVQSGGRVAPGNSPGNLNVSTLTLEGGGGYNWEIANVTGTAGTNWDLITVGGGTSAATISATSGNKFTIYISGNPIGWNTNSEYNWNIIDWGTVSGFDANAFAVDTTGFTGTAPVGTWTFSNTAGYLNLAYTVGDPTWNGGSGNWTTGFTPNLTGGNMSIYFAGNNTATATNNIASATVGSVAGITFNSTAGAYTLAANSGSAGYDTASALQLNGNILNNSTATQTINLALTSTATRVYDAAAGNITIGGVISGTGGLTKNGSNLLTLSANNTYTGDTTINAGTVQITTTGLLGGGSYSGNIANSGALLIGSNSNQTLSGVISGIGALTKNGTGTLTLSGSNTYSGGTTLNTGTLVIGNAAAAGTGTITQSDATSLLKFDTTGTITNAMSVYNVLATHSATLSGAITVNNATWDVDTGDTLTISGAVSGNGGVTKNGGGTLVLSGNNTYAAPTVVNAGTLNANSTNALGSNNTVQVTGGTLLVSADDAVNGKNIELAGSGVGLRFSGNYSGAIGTLTLSANSIIDLGAGSVSIMFTNFDYMDFIANNHTLSIYNWTGTTLWNGGNGTTDTDKVYFGPDLSDEALAKIYFYTGPGDSFLGSGYDLGLQATSWDPSLDGYHIIPVPEPETWATGILLVLGSGVWLWRKRKNFTTQSNLEGAAPSAPIEKMVGLFRRNDPNQRQSRPPALPAKSATI